MAHVSIIGTGNMGSAIAGLVTKGGNTVETFNSADAGKPVTGDVVVLAVPHPAVAGILAERADQLAGKVIVDVTNPINFETYDDLVVAADSSATAGIADAVPTARVVKAFNTNFAGTLATDTLGGQPTTVLIAGDDTDAKSLLAGIVAAAGLRAIDAGGLKRARELESVALLQINLAAAEKVSWSGGFAVVA